MAFLGRVPGQLALRPVLKQTITPDGSASFTLDNQVSQNALDVFVNNVRQEPGVAYTVSGTTITFTEAPAVGSSVYIVYQKSVLGAEVLPGPDTLTTAMIKDGAITAAKLATSVDTHDSAAVQAQFDSAFPSAFDTRFALQDTHDSAAVAGQISATFPSITDSGSKVGIGTASPASLLEIEGADPIITLDDTSAGGYAQVQSLNGSLILMADEGATVNNSIVRFDVDGTERMRINSSGNVGIGIASPSYLVDARTSSGNAQIYLRSGGDLAQLLLISDDSTGTSQINFGDADANNVGLISYSHNQNALKFTGNSAERMRIDNSGNVGIGTTSPIGILHLKSDDNGVVFQSSSSSNSRAQIFFQNNGGTTTGKIALDPDGGNANVMAFSTGTTERMRIDSSGTLGIATTPKAMHASYDGIQVQNSLWFTNNTNFSGFTQNAYYDGSYRYATSREASLFRQINGRFDFLTAASGTADDAITFNTLMQVQAAGKVAINGTTADTTLHVHGSITGGSASSTGGTEVLLAKYVDGSNDQPNIIGTSRSSAAWYICYGLRPSTATEDTFTSSVDNSTWYRGAFRVGGDYAAFRSNGGSAVNTAVGTTIATSEYVRMDHMGISFNGDTATANHLDDYEEGTWTPVLATSNADGSYSMTVQKAVYRKIGGIVFYSTYISAVVATTQGTGNMRITGLPYTSSTEGNSYSGGVSVYGSMIAHTRVHINAPGGSYLRLMHREAVTAGEFDMTAAQLGTGSKGSWIFQGFYPTN